MAFKSLFPHEEELKLNQTLNFYSDEITKKLKKIKNKETKNSKSMQLQLSQVVEANKKALIEELAQTALDINKSTFEGLRTLSADDLANANLEGGKAWIKKNVDLFSKMDDTVIEQLNKERLGRVAELTKDFNDLTSSKIGKLKSGELSKTDLNKMKDTLQGFKKPNKEIQQLINNIDNYDNFTKEDIDNLQQWMDRRNSNWARNETGNFYAEQTKEILETNGMDEYLWISERDNLVRPEHREYDNGEPRKISDGVMPGEDFNCRCHAEPVNQK